MTDDKLILDALRIEPMTGSEIGRGFAPETVKDRAGWGRKWLVRNKDRLVEADGRWSVLQPIMVETRSDTGPDFTIWSVLMDFLRIPNIGGISYKHPLAPRGTPPRLRFPRASRRILRCNH